MSSLGLFVTSAKDLLCHGINTSLFPLRPLLDTGHMFCCMLHAHISGILAEIINTKHL